jgi:hypothetical protein
MDKAVTAKAIPEQAFPIKSVQYLFSHILILILSPVTAPYLSMSTISRPPSTKGPSTPVTQLEKSLPTR